MSEILKKYEISIWEDELVTLSNNSYYKEKKIAIIGSDSMTAKGRVFNPVLTENISGEKTLTFSLQYRYFDDKVGDFITNPIYPLLVNERKIKLFYNDKWYDFLIKSCEESSDEYVFNYTATDLFINELSKQGYNITFDKELNNNTGTVIELAKTIVKDTDWVVDEEDCDLLKQTIDEPLYQCTVVNPLEVTNLSTNNKITLSIGETVYVFYSYIKEKDGKYLQLLRENDRSNWIYDDNNVIIGTNYRYQGTLTVTDSNISKDNTNYLTVGEIYEDNQGSRLVCQPKVVYDPVTEQYVELFHANFSNQVRDVYKSTTSEYGTLGLIQSYVTNGTDFDINTTKRPVGWDNYVLSSKSELAEMTVASYPSLTESAKPVELTKIGGISSYLKIRFPGELSIDKNGQYRNMVFNRGFMDNGATIEKIAKGEKYVFRIRCGKAKDNGRPVNLTLSGAENKDLKIKAYVAFYKTVKQTIDNVSTEVKTFSAKDIIFNFCNEFEESPNVITGGTFNKTKTVYYVDGISQTPSLRYCYRTEGDNNNYIWDPAAKSYIVKNNSYLNYYLSTATAKKTVTNNDLTDPTVKLGIFLATNEDDLISGVNALYIDDIQIFKYEKDKSGSPILPGNVPTATEIKRVDYYLKPKEGTNKAAINVYATKEALADDLKIDPKNIVQDYNKKSEKILSIEESHSNCFNLLQTLCETFECWLKITVEHTSTGAIALDNKNRPKKKISFKEYIGNNNYAGFKYGINLEGINRSVDSSEVVTKLIVAENPNDIVPSGMISIGDSSSNPSGESIIYNFNYYTKVGLISNLYQYKQDLQKFYDQIKPINDEIKSLKQLQSKAEVSLSEARSKVTTLTTYKDTADESYRDALEEFKEKSGVSYTNYVNNHDTIEEPLLETVGKIYALASERNNYSGIITAANQDYKRLKLECNGAEEYTVTITTTKSVDNTPAYTRVIVEDYIPGFEFVVKRGEFKDFGETTLNQKDFEFENGVGGAPYTHLTISSLPKNYKIRYVSLDSGITYTTTGGTFEIYDIDNDKELSRQFVLVPDDNYKNNYKGYKKRIQDKIDEKEKIRLNFEKKYVHYIQEGTWGEDKYIDPNLYYLDAVQVSNTSAQPKVSYSINVVDISMIDGFENYSFQIGDKTYIEDTEFFGWKVDTVNGVDIYTPIKEEVILSEIEWHLDDPSENVITIQNYKTQFEDLFQRISATVQSVQYNEASYTRAAKMLNQGGQIDTKVLQKSLNGLSNDQTPIFVSSAVEFTGDGIQTKDLNSPQNLMKLVAQGLFSSKDGGESWLNIISADGIKPDSLTVGTLDTQKISIVDGDQTSFRWDSNGLSAYGFNEDEGYDLTSFVRMDKYGLYGIKNGDDYVVSSLEDLKNKAHFSVTWDGFRIKNDYGNGYVSISSDNDIEVIKTIPTMSGEDNAEITKIHIGALERDVNGVPLNYGININNDDGEPVFTTDETGNLSITGQVNATSGNFSGNVIVGGGTNKYIVINAEDEKPYIASSDYVEDTSTGWIINSSGDATFNNVSVRGAIKTAVFEYSEIEAVGGAFLFRPSSSIKDAKFDNTYKLSTDISYDSTKDYFEKTQQLVLTQIENYDSTKNPQAEGWYEIDDSDQAILTNDTEWVIIEEEGTISYKVYYSGEFVDVYNGVEDINDIIYVLSTDVVRNPNKKYYSYSEEDSSYNVNNYYNYEIVDSIKHPNENEWYELDVEGNYILSEDSETINNKNYYSLSSEYNYNLININFNPSEENWYEEEYSIPSGISPVNNSWYEKISDDEYILTEDTNIIVNKDYYILIDENQYDLATYELDLSYKRSIDTSVIKNKNYYSLINSNGYTTVNTFFNPAEKGWYEESIEKNVNYKLTEDTEINENYQQIILTEIKNYDSTKNPQEEGWYEINEFNQVVLTDDTEWIIIEEEGITSYKKYYFGETETTYKNYYALNLDGEYILTEPQLNPMEEGLYEINFIELIDSFVLSSDIEKAFDKNYYSLTNQNNYELVVISPVENGWYELIDGNYILTPDNKVLENKEYYIYTEAEEYNLVILNYNPAEENWYEQRALNEYILTEDTEMVDGKQYYSLTIENTYLEVEPNYNPVEEGWYEGNNGYIWIESPEVGDNPQLNGWYEKNEYEEYVLSTDTLVDNNKKYYTIIPLNQDDWGTSNEYQYNSFNPSEDITTINGKRYYSLVINEDNPSELRWHELQDVSPASNGWYEIEASGLVLTVEKPLQFRQYEWVKVSNCTGDPSSVLNDGGLTHVYKIANNPSQDRVIVLEGAENDFIDSGKIMVNGESTEYNISDLIGGALISFGYAQYEVQDMTNIVNPKANELYEKIIEQNKEKYILTNDTTVINNKTYYYLQTDYESGIHNYGIGINSSDNYVGLPERAISLFESNIHPDRSVKVTYDYKGILGTLPPLGNNLVNKSIYDNMAGTQGIFTNNMYIGDAKQYIAFYNDSQGKQLRIKANQIFYEVTDEYGEGTGEYQNVNDIESMPGPPGQDAITVNIESNVGNEFVMSNEQARLTCTVYQGTTDITNKVTKFTWTKLTKDGTPDQTWNQAHEDYNDSYIDIGTNEVNIKAIFNCSVLISEE